MKVRTFLVPGLAGAAVVAAYFAGMHVGSDDANKLYSKVMEQSHAEENGERLWMMHKAAVLLREKRSEDALRVLDQFSDIYVASVAECLDVPECAARLGSARRQMELREIVRYRSKAKKST
jgi:hypothetical protein